jgi:L-threonylcarbamoyladenylate synthase
MNQTIQQTIEVFKNGGIVVFPTDTAYGIGCRMDTVVSVQKVYEIRHRPAEKAVLVLVSDIEMAKKYIEISDEVQKKLIEKYWPGGLTIILPAKTENVLSEVRAGGSTLAVRMPAHEELRNVIGEVGVPVIAPSANFAGEKTPHTFEEIDPKLLKEVDYVWKGECLLQGQSTLVDTTVTPWKVVRTGVVTISV